MHHRYFKSLLSINRKLSWVLLVISGTMLTSGYIQSRIPIDRSFWMPFHTYLGILFTALLIGHFIISVYLLRFKWRSSLKNIINKTAGKWTFIRFIQRASAWLLFASSLLMVFSGLGWYRFDLWQTFSFHPHVKYDTLFAAVLMMHVVTGLKVALTRNKITFPSQNTVLVFIIVFAIIGVFYIDTFVGVKSEKSKTQGNSSNSIKETVNTKPVTLGEVTVGTETFMFDPSEVKTIRPDIFNPSFFSLFDVLVHLSEKNQIDLEYHFDENMNTYVIDNLQEETNWWYYSYYDGGWRETNYFRPDHYPWKDGTTLVFHQVPASRLERTYTIYRKEYQRLKENNGKIVIPRVIVRGKTVQEEFKNVVVTAHNLRNDTFQDGLITAIDVILSLGDQGKITYSLKWYESIGTARIVKNYWVESIGDDATIGRCGFVYESGDPSLQGFAGNHIHLPSDSRVLNSPEYVLYFWICI